MKPLFMVKTYPFFLFATYLFFSCSNDDYGDLPKCKFDNPIEDLVWLKAEVRNREENPTEDMKYCYILQAEFNIETVFVYGDCNPLINKAVYVLDCEGQVIKDKQDKPIYYVTVSLKNEKIIWKPDNFVCEVNY